MSDKKPSSPRVAEHRAKLKDKGLKPLSVMVSELTHKRISEYAAANKINQGAAVDSLLSLPSVTSNDNELKKEINRLNAELTAAKTKLFELQNPTPEPNAQHQSETSEPLNLTPDKVFKYDYYGNERLIALLADDSRVFFKDAGKRWEAHQGANVSHFTEKDNRFYFGTTEIYPVENFKGKLPKTLIMR